MPWTLVRAFLARGRLARLAACVAVALAAVVWIAVASVVLRVVFAVSLLLLVVWCGWLVMGIWSGREASDPTEAGAPNWRAMLPVVRFGPTRAAAEPAPRPSEHTTTAAEDLRRRERELAEREAAFEAVTSSLNALIADLLRGQERLHADAEQLQRELAGQTEAMHAVVARLAQADTPRRTTEISITRGSDDTVDSELDLRAARLELEADLRIEEIEQQEQRLREFEDQLRRREHQLANFVAQTQGRL